MSCTLSDSENNAGELRQAQPHGDRNAGAEEQANTARKGACIGLACSQRTDFDKGHWGSSGWRRATADEGEQVWPSSRTSALVTRLRTAQRPAKFRAIPYGRLRMWLTVAPSPPVAGPARCGVRDTPDRAKRERPRRAGTRNSTRRCPRPAHRRTAEARATVVITAGASRCTRSMQKPRGLALRDIP